MNDPHLLNSREDLFALLRTMPYQDRFNALGIIRRMQNRKITVQHAMEEFKKLFFKNGIFEEGESRE